MSERLNAVTRAPSGPVVMSGRISSGPILSGRILVLASLLVATALVIAIGRPARAAPVDPAAPVAAAAVQQALELLASGDTLTWRDPPSGAAGTIRVTRTWKNRAGQYCRAFVAQRTAPAAPEQRGAACRTGDRVWSLIAR